MILEELIIQWEKDSEFGNDSGSDLRKIPQLHNTYYALLLKTKKIRTGLEEDLEKISFHRRLYYSGQAPAEAYKKEPKNLTILKSDLPFWIKSDSTVKKSREKLNRVKLFEEALTEIIKQINDRRWILKSIIDHQKMVMGDNF